MKGPRESEGLVRTPASHYRVPNENFVLVMLAFLGCFQTDSLDEVVERLNHGSISTIESRDLFFGNGLVRSDGNEESFPLSPWRAASRDHNGGIQACTLPVSPGVPAGSVDISRG